MDLAKSYKAASKGDIKPFESIRAEELDDLVMIPTNNTVLHTNIIFQDPKNVSTNFAKKILQKRPSLLLKVNADGDVALHVAAKFGYFDIVEVIIECANDLSNTVDSELGLELPTVKWMLRRTNNDGNTPLHLAIQFDNYEVVKRLIKEDHEYAYQRNSYGKPPLYIAVERNAWDLGDIVKLILDDCSSIAYEGPDGMTALHIAASCHWPSSRRDGILKKLGTLTKVTDNKGWTPLHHAVYAEEYDNVNELLAYDAAAACIPDRGRKMTPLHIAAGLGNINLMNLIVSRCRECCEMVDNRGWNYLHFAALSLSIKTLKEHKEKNQLVCDRLMDQTDTKGNTPFHLCAYLHGKTMFPILKLRPIQFRILYLRNNQKQSVESLCLAGGDPNLKAKHDIKALVDEGVLRVWNECLPQEEAIKEIEKANESHLVVAALIATVTFAAAFTLPGGYESENGHTKGFAILSNSSAFQAFVICDAIALLLSLTAVFIHFMMSMKTILKRYTRFFFIAACLTILAMEAMILAFVAGAYAVLAHSLWLAIPTCVIGLSFFGFAFPIMYKVTKQTFESKEMSNLVKCAGKSAKNQ